VRGALKLDPHYAAAHAYLAWSHQMSFTHGGFDEADKILWLQHAHAAIANDVDDATALAVGAMVVGLLGKDVDAALDAIQRSLSNNPSSAFALYCGAELYAWSVDPATAIAYAQRGLRLSLFDQLAFHAHLAFTIAATQEGRYDEAAAQAAKVVQANPSHGVYMAYQAISLALAGRVEKARPIFARALELEPEFSYSHHSRIGIRPGNCGQICPWGQTVGGARVTGGCQPWRPLQDRGSGSPTLAHQEQFCHRPQWRPSPRPPSRPQTHGQMTREPRAEPFPRVRRPSQGEVAAGVRAARPVGTALSKCLLAARSRRSDNRQLVLAPSSGSACRPENRARTRGWTH
jgi:tetratricopeptide (TPR) repeat protein